MVYSNTIQQTYQRNNYDSGSSPSGSVPHDNNHNQHHTMSTILNNLTIFQKALIALGALCITVLAVTSIEKFHNRKEFEERNVHSKQSGGSTHTEGTDVSLLHQSSSINGDQECDVSTHPGQMRN